jgi:hypothetical protein
MGERIKGIGTIIGLIAVSMLVGGLVSSFTPKTIHHTGVVTDADISSSHDVIDWGTLLPTAQSVERTVIISANVPMNYTVVYSPPTPSNLWDYMSISHNGTWLLDLTENITFTLTVFENITGIENFNFDITIWRV